MKTAPELQSSTSIIIRNSFAVPFAATLMFAPSACGTSGPTSPALIADLLPSVRRIVVHEARCAPHSAGASLNAQRHGKNREHQHFSSDDAESQPRISEWLNTSNFKTDDGEPWLVGMLLADPTRIAFPQLRVGFGIGCCLLASSGCYRAFFALLAAQYAFIRWPTALRCAADIGLRFRLPPPAPTVAALGLAAPRLRSARFRSTASVGFQINAGQCGPPKGNLLYSWRDGER